MFSIHKLNSLSSFIAVTKGTEMNSKGTVVTLNDKVLTKYKQLSGSCSKTVKISMVANSLLIPETGRAKKWITLPTCLVFPKSTCTTEDICLLSEESSFWAFHTWDFPCTFFSTEKSWRQLAWSKVKTSP